MPKRSQPPEAPPLEVKQPHDVVRSKIQERIDKGGHLRARKIVSNQDVEAFSKDYEKWDDYNATLLASLFTNDSPVTEYTWSVSVGMIPYDESSYDTYHRQLEALTKKSDQLESLLERVELIPLASGVGAGPRPSISPSPDVTDRVFVVHGHDTALREAVARFIERVGLRPVVLHEQPSGGKTLIEKLEHHADVGFAIVLLSPDDEGRGKGAADLQPRARQNVLLELGFFVGRLGRNKVCALHRGQLEFPSDILGVIYVPFDEPGAWRLLLARELRQAGFTIDLNQAM